MTNRIRGKLQQGFVSIMVTMIVMSIMTVIVVSFALLMRREQRQALDRQLSTQAFYAAESGVNDAVAALKVDPSLTQDNCPAGGGRSFSAYDNNLDSSHGVAYTCVLIKQNPTSLKYKGIGTDSSVIVPVNTDGTGETLVISWQDSNGSTTFASANASTHHFLPEAAATGTQDGSFVSQTGILRTTIMPIRPNLSRAKLTNDEQTIFLYPTTDQSAGVSGSMTYSSSEINNGIFADGHCNAANTPQYCSVRIKIAPNDLPPATTMFYLRLKAVYKPVDVNIQVFDNSATPVALPLLGGQAEIDSTGKANDVLRRIQVRVPLQANAYFPEYALESGDTICKRLQVWPGGATVDDNITQGTHPENQQLDFNKSYDFGATGSCYIGN